MGPKSTMIFWVISLLKCCLTWLELKYSKMNLELQLYYKQSK